MGKRINEIGNVYGRLTVLGEAGNDKAGRLFWHCQCSCGGSSTVRGDQLRSGQTKSCGCHQRERIVEASTTHGMSKSATYTAWVNLVQRCTNPNTPKYKNYGGRGIMVCDRWLESFANFYEDMGERPEGTSIDRRNNDKGYSPNNCRWADRVVQANNTRANRWFTVNGISKTVAQWSRALGESPVLVASRVDNSGWSLSEAVSVPAGGNRNA